MRETKTRLRFHYCVVKIVSTSGSRALPPIKARIGQPPAICFGHFPIERKIGNQKNNLLFFVILLFEPDIEKKKKKIYLLWFYFEKKNNKSISHNCKSLKKNKNKTLLPFAIVLSVLHHRVSRLKCNMSLFSHAGAYWAKSKAAKSGWLFQQHASSCTGGQV